MRRRLAALSCRRCSVSWAQGDGRQQEDKHHSPPSDSTDVKMASCPELCGSEYGDGGPQRYGVRSYLHQFYEDCTSSIWERHHDEFQMQRSPSRWSSVLWKVCVAVGAVILVSGLSVLLVGYATPPRLEAFGEDELLFVDGRAMRFNRALDACKLGGAVLFCVGGAGVAAGLLLLAVCGQGGAKDELQLQRRFKERLAEIQASVPNSGDAKVPVTLSKVQNIQPGAEP